MYLCLYSLRNITWKLVSLLQDNFSLNPSLKDIYFFFLGNQLFTSREFNEILGQSWSYKSELGFELSIYVFWSLDTDSYYMDHFNRLHEEIMNFLIHFIHFECYTSK